MALNENNKDKRSKMYLGIMIVLLFLINFGLIYKLISKDNELDSTKTELQDTSVELEELKKVEEDLQLQLQDKIGKNARLDSIINVRDAAIRSQVSRLRKALKRGDISKAELEEAKGEIASLRAQITSLTTEIEELSKQNQYLKDEVYVVQTQVAAEKEKVAELETTQTELEATVQKGKRIRLTVDATPMKKTLIGDGFKPTDKLSKMDQLDIKYKLINNDIADKGEKTLYFQVMTPNKTAIHSSEAGSGKFSYDGGDRLYTVKRVVDFQNNAEYGTFSLAKTEGMTPGKYTLNVYSETHLMGTTTFSVR